MVLWNGQDGYHINILENKASNKKVTSRAFYSYLIMEREGKYNPIHLCRELVHQYLMDMYAKKESERLLYQKLNQKQLRVESYLHLKDEIETDRGTNLGKSVFYHQALHEYSFTDPLGLRENIKKQ